jgi:hypothetical protein
MGMLPTLTPVAALGFPFGYDPERLAVTSRGFAGNIVGSYRHTGFPGHPHVYELSFAAPRGLSGGPLLRGESGLSRVAAGMASSSASHNPPDADVQ